MVKTYSFQQTMFGNNYQAPPTQAFQVEAKQQHAADRFIHLPWRRTTNSADVFGMQCAQKIFTLKPRVTGSDRQARVLSYSHVTSGPNRVTSVKTRCQRSLRARYHCRNES
eukprot:GHVL01024767.1.p1 GENE.GHVL01024767.1~~GHVL01024767.1.p1  ORF type:complete len:111 (-),score=7.39 GHVL01024767.1:16-348(-)